ncbi:MAG: hypothetical protein M1827_005267 [Pycnora praestabilis]|nr:MAG: hypothetical protein M1827_005267 [Pycnora praestabilis]
MACTRSFSFPLSQHEQSYDSKSPFSLQPDDAEDLRVCEGFQIVRQYLATEQRHSFCVNHIPANDEDEAAWLLHRDITHALILPILQIYRRACQLASSSLHTKRHADLELAYKADGRGAFSWLQCFVAEEEDWCNTKGCPVNYVLQSEPTIRLVLVASRLSHHLRFPPHSNNNSNASPSLPLFTFWLNSLHTALDNDAFWGPGYWDDIETRATSLERGIQDLMAQCRDIESVLAYKTSDNSKAVVVSVEEISQTPSPTDNTIRVRGSQLAKRQMMLLKEEEHWMRKILVRCWSNALTDELHVRRRDASSLRPLAPVRVRSLTS